MLLLLGLVALVFGEEWVVFGIPARVLGGGLVVLGIAEAFYWRSRMRRGQTDLADTLASEAEGEEVEEVAGVRFPRHVPLVASGKGATFYLQRSGDKYQWSWDFDEGLTMGGMMGAVDKAIGRMEQRLGLPFSAPPVGGYVAQLKGIPWEEYVKQPPSGVRSWPWESEEETGPE